MAPYGRQHARWIVFGAGAALVVVAIRLTLPWPLRAMMEPWIAESPRPATGLLALVPSGTTPIVAMGGLFFLLLVGLGFADFLERLYFARFSIGTVRDLRADAFRAASQTRRGSRKMGSGDVVARLIVDTARIKAGLKGFLIHVATNGLLLAGVTVVLLCVYVALGAVFVVAGLLVGALTVWGDMQHVSHCAVLPPARRKTSGLYPKRLDGGVVRPPL